jgi:Transposase DDE domain
MDMHFIVTTYTVFDDLLKRLNYQEDCRSQMSAAEVLTVAVVAAKYFQNHHERALCVMRMGKMIPEFSVSRFNRRLHALSDWFEGILRILGELFCDGVLYIIDSMPLPVRKRVRAWRCRKVRGAEYCGYCAAKKEKYFGWKLHLVCTVGGIPVNFDILPASEHDLTPVHELCAVLPNHAQVFGDKGYLSQADQASLADVGVELIAPHRKNMEPLHWTKDYDLKKYRRNIETVNSQLASMGINRLHARTMAGFELKVWASLFAVVFSRAFTI